MISIIVPVYNEEKVLSEKPFFFRECAGHGELIFVDGGSSDKSVQIAGSYGKLLQTEKGRAVQMNCGARHAGGDILLFLHADTFVPVCTLRSIEGKIRNRGFIGGCLTQRIDSPGAAYRCIESLGNMRARITGIFYGDQGIFVRKDVFFRMGGFPEVPLMEDVLFTRRLRRHGRTIVLPDKIFVSPRRWERKGVIRTGLLYSFLNILFWVGVPPKRAERFYDDLR